MTHQVLNSVLAAQRANATLCGRDLRTAAENLLHLTTSRTVLKALDAVGERIIGAALLLDDDLRTWDYTRPFPSKSACLLVGGVVAGPVGISSAGEVVTAAGATSVEAAVLSGWTSPVPGVAQVREIGSARMQVVDHVTSGAPQGAASGRRRDRLTQRLT